MISHIHIENFKSIHTAPDGLELRPLNVLIGKNGSGKSNFLKFFDFMRAAANGRMREWITSAGGFREIHYYGSQLSDTISFELTFPEFYSSSKENVYYSAEIAGRGTSGYVVVNEKIERDPSRGHKDRFKFLAVVEGRVRFLKAPGAQEISEESDDFNDLELVTAQLQNKSRYPVLSRVRDYLASWQAFRGFGADALQKIITPQLLNPIGEEFRFSEKGDEIISILHALANQSEYSSIYNDLINVLRTAFPDLEKFDVRIVAGAGMGTLTYRSRYFDNPAIPLSSMSDGQLRFLGMALLLLLPTSAQLITLDEPEIGLHPSMLPVLAELLNLASERTQLIVSTHSPELVTRLRPEDVITVENEDGRSRLTRLNKDSLGSWLNRYTLGQLWTMGKLTYS